MLECLHVDDNLFLFVNIIIFKKILLTFLFTFNPYAQNPDNINLSLQQFMFSSRVLPTFANVVILLNECYFVLPCPECCCTIFHGYTHLDPNFLVMLKL